MEIRLRRTEDGVVTETSQTMHCPKEKATSASPSQARPTRPSGLTPRHGDDHRPEIVNDRRQRLVEERLHTDHRRRNPSERQSTRMWNHAGFGPEYSRQMRYRFQLVVDDQLRNELSESEPIASKDDRSACQDRLPAACSRLGAVAYI